MDNGALPGVLWPERTADHLHMVSGQIAWSWTSSAYMTSWRCVSLSMRLTILLGGQKYFSLDCLWPGGRVPVTLCTGQ